MAKKKDEMPAWVGWTVMVAGYIALGGGLVWALWYREGSNGTNQ